MYKKIIEELKTYSQKEKQEVLPKFFKTGKGEYGEGDIFIGVTVPNVRLIAKKYKDVGLLSVEKMLNDPIHEVRLLALIILTYKFEKASEEEQKNIYEFYLKNTKAINNWDLVDLSAYKIVGKYLINKDRDILFKLAESKNLWEQRISIISTFYFIQHNDFQTSLIVSEMLLNHDHDLIHKAVGWMLREIGKRDLKIEEDFLKLRYQQMPRTMLRYAIEKFEEEKRQKYLKGLI